MAVWKKLTKLKKTKKVKITNRTAVKITYVCAQLEIGGKNAKMHIQGMFIVSEPLTKEHMIKVVKHLFGTDGENKFATNLSWPTLGNTTQSRNYCTKPTFMDREWVAGDRVVGTDWYEYGLFEEIDGHSPAQGERSDLTDIYEFVEEDPTISYTDMLDHFRGTSHFGSCVRYEKFFMQVKQKLLQKKLLSIMKESHDALRLRRWQAHIVELLSGIPHTRHIIVILDQSGGSGKSVLSAICMSTYGMHCQGSGKIFYLGCHRNLFSVSGKREDLSYAFSSFFRENPKCKGICLDIPKAATLGSEFRTGAFTFAEQVKSQLVPVTKYESTVLIVPPMHVILFTNTPIPEGAFAEDRVHLITLTKAADVWNWTTKII